MKSSGSKAAAREDLLPIAVDNPNARWQEVFQSMAQYSIEPNEITGILKAVFEELVKTSKGSITRCRARKASTKSGLFGLKSYFESYRPVPLVGFGGLSGIA